MDRLWPLLMKLWNNRFKKPAGLEKERHIHLVLTNFDTKINLDNKRDPACLIQLTFPLQSWPH